MAERMVVEFPAETVEFIDNLSKELKLDRVEVISRGLGLLKVWVDARKKFHVIVERPIKGAGEESEIEVATPANT